MNRERLQGEMGRHLCGFGRGTTTPHMEPTSRTDELIRMQRALGMALGPGLWLPLLSLCPALALLVLCFGLPFLLASLGSVVEGRA